MRSKGIRANFSSLCPIFCRLDWCLKTQSRQRVEAFIHANDVIPVHRSAMQSHETMRIELGRFVGKFSCNLRHDFGHNAEIVAQFL